MYMSTHPNYDFESYKKAANEATIQFNELSKAVIEISREFKTADRHTLATILETLQEKEKDKLQLVSGYEGQSVTCESSSAASFL